MAATDPAHRALIARLAAYTRWAQCADPKAATAKTRSGFMARFERQVDPDGTLPPTERRRRADAAMRAHMTRLALKSSQARKPKRNGSVA
jgi:hypothetical protein